MPEFELDADLKAFVEERLGPIVDEVPPPEEDEEEAEPEAEPEEEPEPEGEEEPPAADLIEVAPGINLTREQALSYYQLDSILRDRPEVYEQVAQVLQQPGSAGGAASPQPSPPPALPEIDPEYLEDPAVRAIYDLAQAQIQANAQLQQQVHALQDVTVTREQEEIQTLINQTQANFATSHNLTDEEVARVATTAERLNLLPSLLRGVDPITGAAEPRDRATALNRAFDIAYWFIPEFRDREMAAQVTKRAASTKRKQKLAGIGGSGTMPKEPAGPMNPTERRNAMIRDVAQMMGVSPGEEE